MPSAEQRDVYIPSIQEETQNHSHRAYCPATDAIEWFRNRTVFRMFLWLTSRADIAHIKPNAHKITQRFGNEREFKFDFRVRYWDGREELIVMRRAIDLIPNRNGDLVPEHWDTVSLICERNGQHCRFFTDETIAPFEMRIDNWQRMLPYLQLAAQVPGPRLRESIHEQVRRHKTLPLDQLIKAFAANSAQEVLSEALSLVWQNNIGCDLDTSAWSTALVVTDQIEDSVNPPAAKIIEVANDQDLLIPIAEDPESWPAIPAASIEDVDRRTGYERNRGIVWDRLVRGNSVKDVAKAYNCHRSWVTKLTVRCQQIKDDGEPWGWEGAIPFSRFPALDSVKTESVSPSETNVSTSGRALSRFFARYPHVEKAVLDAALPKKRPKRKQVSGRRGVSSTKVWKVFNKEVKALGLPLDHWPHNTSHKGKEAIRRFVRRLEDSHTARYLDVYVGNSAKVVWNATQPNHGITPQIEPYAYFQADGHDSNAYSAISIPDTAGMDCVLPLGRFWLLPCMDVGSRAVMGMSITPELNYASIDLLDSIFNCLVPWERLENGMPEKSFRPGAGMPSGVHSFCAWRGIDMIRLDNALAHLSRESQERIVQSTGAVVVTSLPDHKTSNAVVERFFGSFEDVFGAGPSSTGSNPSDIRREDPVGAAVRNRIEFYLLEALAECVVANYNATPHTALNGRTPLQYLRDWHRLNPHTARFIPDRIQADLPLYYRTFPATIRRNEAQGGACYIEWLYSRHTNDLIAAKPSYADTKVLLTVDTRDARKIWAHTLRGEPLGQLEPQDRWALRAHTLRERRIIGAFRRGNLIDTDTTDPVGDLHEIIHERAHLDSDARRKLAAQRYPQPAREPQTDTTAPASTKTPRDFIPITGHYYK